MYIATRSGPCGMDISQLSWYYCLCFFDLKVIFVHYPMKLARKKLKSSCQKKDLGFNQQDRDKKTMNWILFLIDMRKVNKIA